MALSCFCSLVPVASCGETFDDVVDNAPFSDIFSRALYLPGDICLLATVFFLLLSRRLRDLLHWGFIQLMTLSANDPGLLFLSSRFFFSSHLAF
jgi:hypothetical protein